MNTVGELKAALAAYPDDLPLAAIASDGDLDPQVQLDMAVEYAPGRRDGRGRTWRWHSGHDAEGDERETVVVY